MSGGAHGGGGAPELEVDGSGARVAIVASRWHETVMAGLLDGAKRTLTAAGVEQVDVTQPEPGSDGIRVAAVGDRAGHVALSWSGRAASARPPGSVRPRIPQRGDAVTIGEAVESGGPASAALSSSGWRDQPRSHGGHGEGHGEDQAAG